MPITEAAYETDWTWLIDRYYRPRHIVDTLLETFVILPSTARADVSVLRKVADGETKIVRGFYAAGQTNTDCWIIHFILAKIDEFQHRKWIELLFALRRLIWDANLILPSYSSRLLLINLEQSLYITLFELNAAPKWLAS